MLTHAEQMGLSGGQPVSWGVGRDAPLQWMVILVWVGAMWKMSLLLHTM